MTDKTWPIEELILELKRPIQKVFVDGDDMAELIQIAADEIINLKKQLAELKLKEKQSMSNEGTAKKDEAAQVAPAPGWVLREEEDGHFVAVNVSGYKLRYSIADQKMTLSDKNGDPYDLPVEVMERLLAYEASNLQKKLEAEEGNELPTEPANPIPVQDSSPPPSTAQEQQ